MEMGSSRFAPGPGLQYRKLAELHNGDVVHVFDQKGKQAGAVYGELSSDECSSKEDAARDNSAKGWVHSKWLKDLAG